MTSWLHTLWSRCRATLTRSRLDREFDEELATHLELLIEEGCRSGLSPAEARREAIRRLGRPDSLREAHRGQRGLPAVEVLGHDLRYAVRMLWRSPAVTFIAALSLALGIGANTALFSLTDSLLLRSLPVRDPDRLVQVQQVMVGLGIRKPFNSFAKPVFDDVRSRTRIFSEVVGFSPLERPVVAVDGIDEPPRAVETVSHNFFLDLGVAPVVGRHPDPSDGPAAILSHQLWRTRFAGDPAVLGRAVSVDGRPYTILGVAPPRFHGLSIERPADLWISSSTPGRHQMIARLDPEVTAAQAQQEVHSLLRRIAQEQPALVPWDERGRTEIVPAGRGLSVLREEYARPLLALGALVTLVLLVTCANVASLLIVRNAARRRELSVRIALGAGRSRLVRQYLVESAGLAGLGGALGLLLARRGVSIMLSMLPLPVIPAALSFQADARVLAFAAAVSLLSAVMFGLAPAWRAGQVDVSGALRASQGSTPSRRTRRMGRTLVACQVGLSVLLLVAAGLFVQTLRNLGRFDVGFNPESLLQVTLDTRGAGYRQGQVGPLYHLLLERLAALPVVRSVTGIRNPVMTGAGSRSRCDIPGRTLDPDEAWDGAAVGPGFFETVGIPLLRGRTFTDADFLQNRSVGIVSDAFAKRYFPGEDPVGKRICDGLEIVGIVADARLASVRAGSGPMLYFKAAQEPDRFSALEVRVAGDPSTAATAIGGEIRKVNPRLLIDVTTMRRQIETSMARERMLATVSAFFGLLGLLLAAVGIFGVASYTVAQRTTELGIRMALGAGRWTVIRESMGETMAVFAVGLTGGVFASVIAVRLATGLIANLLFGLSPTDAVSVVAAVGVMVIVALAACILPARRATSIDPLTAIRCE